MRNLLTCILLSFQSCWDIISVSHPLGVIKTRRQREEYEGLVVRGGRRREGRRERGLTRSQLTPKPSQRQKNEKKKVMTHINSNPGVDIDG
jgi:hypothetical protein